MISLGLAQWSTPQWRGQLFSNDDEGRRTLHQYSSVFHCVEGNTTFYALPKPETVSKWAEEAGKGFEFCFKLPRDVTHTGTLDPHHEELKIFFERLAPLEPYFGPFMLQLPANMGADSLYELETFLDCLPHQYSYSLEVRHPVFFEKGEAERQLNRMLAAREINRTCMDTRALFSVPPSNEAIIDAQKKKPHLPVHAVATADRPMIRFIGCMEVETNTEYWQPWLEKISQWLQEGRRPIVFIHTPDNLEAPLQAKAFYEQLQQHCSLPDLPPFPGENNLQEDLF
ncbi:DUF72 domain-containing protein [Parendozoicomonas haliclonae]|uniref:DUF72 domain-containing protein n=1 Tax=Parendozoicomonas haliclonae TaxID=1960125 RepID=A0A1X7AH87_9GAMM|nr:DUF72 domain-containing protein [Parendozoicomonas haliclonae]SMA40603.1 hypothetical protein EHSB41UT_01210 [Parendozoicomonas haliclonae]